MSEGAAAVAENEIHSSPPERVTLPGRPGSWPCSGHGGGLNDMTARSLRPGSTPSCEVRLNFTELFFEGTNRVG